MAQDHFVGQRNQSGAPKRMQDGGQDLVFHFFLSDRRGAGGVRGWALGLMLWAHGPWALGHGPVLLFLMFAQFVK